VLKGTKKTYKIAICCLFLTLIFPQFDLTRGLSQE